MGLGRRWHELARTYAEVNMAFGDISRSPQQCRRQAIFWSITHDHAPVNSARRPQLHFPPSVIDMFIGSLRRARRRMAQALQKICPEGAKPQRGARAHLPGGRSRGNRRLRGGRRSAASRADEVLSYLMYPMSS